MVKRVRVQQGDCCNSLAYKFGFHEGDQIWNDPSNEALRKIRLDPALLVEGDIITIPEIETKKERLTPEKSHRFVVTRPTITFRQRYLDSNGKPETGNFVLVVDGKTYSGSLKDGIVEQRLAGNCRFGHLTVTFSKGAPCEEQVWFGHLDPADTVTGAQARLLRAGWMSGEVRDNMDPMAIESLQMFQKENGLPLTGQLDEGTVRALAQLDTV